MHALLGGIMRMAPALLEPGVIIERLTGAPLTVDLRMTLPPCCESDCKQQKNQSARPHQSSVTQDLASVLGGNECKHVSSSCA